MSLSAFLAQNAKKVEEVEYIVSERFTDETGNPIPWKIVPITGKRNKELLQSCTKTVPIPGKRGQYRSETDSPAYTTKMAVACTAFPDLNNAELQNSYGVMGAEALLETMLLPGELTDYQAKVQEVCGFDIGMAEKVETAKN
ncbi:MAG: phage portal protein [Butyricicoccus sp.]